MKTTAALIVGRWGDCFPVEQGRWQGYLPSVTTSPLLQTFGHWVVVLGEAARMTHSAEGAAQVCRQQTPNTPVETPVGPTNLEVPPGLRLVWVSQRTPHLNSHLHQPQGLCRHLQCELLQLDPHLKRSGKKVPLQAPGPKPSSCSYIHINVASTSAWTRPHCLKSLHPMSSSSWILKAQ